MFCSTYEQISEVTGMRLRCLILPVLFVITIDWVLQQTIDRTRSIQWTLLKDKSKLRLLRLILRMPDNKIPKASLIWTPA